MWTSLRAVFFVTILNAVALPGLARPLEPADSNDLRAAARGEVDGEISLEQAISRAMELNPSLAAGALAVSVAEARVTQAGLLPNPELELEMENIGGGGDLAGFSAAETTAVISQPVLLGGKRARHRAVAESDHRIAGRDLEAGRLDVVSKTTTAFYLVVAAQQRIALADELLDLSERFARTVQARVDAGKVSPVEATRAGIEVARARVRRARTLRRLIAARALLAASWGSSMASFEQAAGELPEPNDPPSISQLRPLLKNAPEITRLDDQIERQRRVIELERSFRIPDLTLRVGPRRFEQTGESAWVAGISVPIPIFNRHQGSRKAAEFELERERRDAEATRVAIEAELAVALERVRATALAAITVDREVVPAADAAFVATERGYNEGKFGFLDVLDAQRALFEARSMLLDSREEFAINQTELDRLIGRRVGSALTSNSTGRQVFDGITQ